MAKSTIVQKNGVNGELMSRKLTVVAFLLASFTFSISCNKQGGTLTKIQDVQSGNYIVALLSDTGGVKQHSNRLTLEIRNAASNEPANVTNVQIQSSMRMPGMGPMFGNLSSVRQISPGRYDFDADFSMSGQWNFLVTFDPDGRVQFNINAQ